MLRTAAAVSVLASGVVSQRLGQRLGSRGLARRRAVGKQQILAESVMEAPQDQEDYTDPEGFEFHDGYISAGEDRGSVLMTFDKAVQHCAEMLWCDGFTYQGERNFQGELQVYMKTKWNINAPDGEMIGWSSYKKLTPAVVGCADNTSFLDEQGYACDPGWISIDCSMASKYYGLTDKGQQDLLANCKKTCGLCPDDTRPPSVIAPEWCINDDFFLDEQGYNCVMGWTGYDCETAVTKLGYSEAGMQDVIKHCPLVCGMCDTATRPPQIAAEASASASPGASSASGSPMASSASGAPSVASLSNPVEYRYGPDGKAYTKDQYTAFFPDRDWGTALPVPSAEPSPEEGMTEEPTAFVIPDRTSGTHAPEVAPAPKESKGLSKDLMGKLKIALIGVACVALLCICNALRGMCKRFSRTETDYHVHHFGDEDEGRGRPDEEEEGVRLVARGPWRGAGTSVGSDQVPGSQLKDTTMRV